MLTEELVIQLRRLNHVDKLRAVQILVNEMAIEEAGQLQSGAQYEIWSPYDAGGAAEVLAKMLEEDQKSQHG